MVAQVNSQERDPTLRLSENLPLQEDMANHSQEKVSQTFEAIPKNALGVIGTFLPLGDLLSFSKVSKAANAAFHAAGAFMGNSAFVELVLIGLARNESLQAFQQAYPLFATLKMNSHLLRSITTLDLTTTNRSPQLFTWQYGENKMQEVRDLFPNVFHLKVEETTAESLYLLTKNQHNLQHLSVSEIRHASQNQEKIAASLVQLPALETLSLACPFLTSCSDTLIQALITSHLKDQLKELDLTNALTISSTALAKLAQMTRLQKLNLTRTHANDKVVAAISSGPTRTQLVELNLTECREASARSLQNLASMTVLEKLILCDTEVDFFVIEALVKSPLKTHLKELDVSFCRALSEDGLSKISELSALTSLSLRSTKTTFDVLDELVTSPLKDRLKKLNLAHCADLTSDAFKLLGHFNELQELDVSFTVFDENLLFYFARRPLVKTVTKLNLSDTLVGCLGLRVAVEWKGLQELRWCDRDRFNCISDEEHLKCYAHNKNLRLLLT